MGALATNSPPSVPPSSASSLAPAVTGRDRWSATSWSAGGGSSTGWSWSSPGWSQSWPQAGRTSGRATTLRPTGKEECHLTGTAAWNALVVGEQAARMPESTRALVAGEIGYAHLTLMARTADWVAGLPVVAVDLLAAGRPDAAAAGAADPGTAPADAAASGAPLPPPLHEGALPPRARGHSVAELRHDCGHFRHAADPRRFLTEQVEHVEARFLELKTVEGGALLLRGYLDSEGGATLRTALEPLARPCGEGDGRT